MGKPRLNLRLRADLHRKLEAATRRPGVTKNALIEKALQEAAADPPTWLLVAGHYPVYSASKTVFVIFVSSKEGIEN